MVMKQYVLLYREGEHGGYRTAEDFFNVGPHPRDAHDGYLTWGHFDNDDDARYAMYARLEDVKRKWPELNEYPYGEPRMYEREVSAWEPIS